MDLAAAGSEIGLGGQVDTRPRLTLQNNADDILHLVCCRDPEWKVAFCGYEDDSINMMGKQLCTMCIEVVRRRDPLFGLREFPVCPIDQTPCPDEHEIDQRILKEVSP